MKSIKLLIILVVLTFTQIGLAQSPYNALDTLFKTYVEGVSPGLAVGVVKNGNLIYENYFGYANLEHQVKIDSSTRFNIASNAKQFTSLCILKLQKEGQLNLDDDIRKYLPNLYLDIATKITIANLITHSSGIRDVYDLWALQGKTWYQLFIDNTDAIELIENQKELNFEPGTTYLYSNSNYILLTEIVETVTDTKFADFAETVLKELGMSNTSFLTNYMAIIPNKARPYGNWNGWKEYPFITETHGDGALFTTLKDQLQWEAILQEGSSEFLNKDIVKESQSPLKNVAINQYGFGVMFGEYKEHDYAYHDGSTGAYNATFLRLPKENLAIVVMSNNGNVPTNYLSKKVADKLLNIEEETIEYPSGPSIIGQFQKNPELLGTYQNDEGTIINIVERDGRLYRDLYQSEPTHLINQEGNLFYYETNKDLKVAFTEGPSGQKQFKLYLFSQPPNTFKRIESSKLNVDYKNSLNGTFFNDETNTTIRISYEKGNTYTVEKNGEKREGELIYRDVLRMNSYVIKVHRNKKDAIEGLLINNGRIQNVWFTKEQ